MKWLVVRLASAHDAVTVAGWDDPPTSAQVSETLDACARCSRCSPFLVHVLEALLELRRDAEGHGAG